MAEHLLHRPQICTALQQMCCEGMAQRVWRNRFGYSHLVDVLAKNFPRAHARKRLTARVEEEDPFAFAFLQLRTQFA